MMKFSNLITNALPHQKSHRLPADLKIPSQNYRDNRYNKWKDKGDNPGSNRMGSLRQKADKDRRL